MRSCAAVAPCHISRHLQSRRIPRRGEQRTSHSGPGPGDTGFWRVACDHRQGNVDGVRIAGLILQAGPKGATSLLQWGEASSRYAGNPDNPGFLHDVFARVGGPDGTPTNPVSVDTMIVISNGNVVGDNLWLWRADHSGSGPITYDSNACSHGLVVDGDNVTMYGLAVEHTEKDLTVWNGNNGATYFYQSELPYGVTQQQYSNYSGYLVGSSVSDHRAFGVGVDSFFRDYEVTVNSGVRDPEHLVSNFVSPFTIFLNGMGGISHIVNDQGAASTSASSAHQNYLC